MRYIVYKIGNLETGKCYIGQTRRTLKVRWDAHWNRAIRNDGSNNKFHNALRKYTKAPFDILIGYRFKLVDL